MMVSVVSTDDKTTLSISLTKSEKRFLKIYCVLTRWIEIDTIVVFLETFFRFYYHV